MTHLLGKVLAVGAALAALAAFVTWRENFESGSLKGARVLVTGASTGIGEQMAYRYARFGAQIVITARREHILHRVNFLSYLQMTSRALPSLEESRGSIVVVSSLLGKMSSPFVGPYAATKFALSGFFGSLRHEMTMRGSNVTITMCFLGLIDTQSAMEKVKGYTNTKAHPASEAALHIIKAGATRQWDTFYPWHLYYMILTGNLHPFIWDFIIRSVYSN
ncbi:hydroxysteroid 11-beta-dehydrogenase 1-like protein [Scleropages formosus]|uniref:hydroxysteroid 11-beta-dehydrogenase 1-like protein n=1 Tax=Scleropages formosus TaxID=113540 RepID=UPI0010FAC1A8|nr:hydroxysteroid 11-beta-dehydrogenase 1-like protein [Scleropages formosus]